MKKIGAYEAKTRLSRLLDEVAAGETITITKHGVPVAVLGPVAGPSPLPLGEAIAQLKSSRKGRTLGGLTFRELIEAGRA